MTEQEIVNNLNSLVGKHVLLAYRDSGAKNLDSNKPLLSGLCKLGFIRTKEDIQDIQDIQIHKYVASFNEYCSLEFFKEDVLNGNIEFTLAKDVFPNNAGILSLPESIRTED
jgi:hypothetical protein